MNTVPFLSKKYSFKKLISCLNEQEQPNMLTRQEYKSEIYRMSRILEQIYKFMWAPKQGPDPKPTEK